MVDERERYWYCCSWQRRREGGESDADASVAFYSHMSNLLRQFPTVCGEPSWEDSKHH